MIHATPRQIVGEPRDLARHCPKIRVMAKAGSQSRAFYARLIGINLPGMEVEDARNSFLPIYPCNRPAGKSVRKKTKVAAAGYRKVAAERPDRCKGNFQERSSKRAKRPTRRLGHAVKIMDNRVNARTIGISLFGENLVSPPRFGSDRKRR